MINDLKKMKVTNLKTVEYRRARRVIEKSKAFELVMVKDDDDAAAPDDDYIPLSLSTCE